MLNELFACSFAADVVEEFVEHLMRIQLHLWWFNISALGLWLNITLQKSHFSSSNEIKIHHAMLLLLIVFTSCRIILRCIAFHDGRQEFLISEKCSIASWNMKNIIRIHLSWQR